MEDKLEKRELLTTTDGTGTLDGPIDEIPGKIQALVDGLSLEHFYDRLEIKFDDYCSYEIGIIGIRNETDKEYETRIARVEARQVAGANRVRKKQIDEKKELARLKKKYPNE